MSLQPARLPCINLKIAAHGAMSRETRWAGEQGSVSQTLAQAIAPINKTLEYLANRGMVDRPAFRISKQILLAHIGNIAGVLILSEEVIEGLFAMRSDLGRNRFIPFLAVREDRIDIDDDAAETEMTVANNIADCKSGLGP